MAKVKSQFVCQQCGYAQSQWAGKCPNCHSWNSLVEMRLQNDSEVSGQKRETKIYKLADVQAEHRERMGTGEMELDSVLGGGGLVEGMVVLVAGEPGIGKSTLLTQVAVKMGNALYVCGEEAVGQVALRVKRLMVEKIKEVNFSLVEGTDVDGIVEKIEEMKPGVVVIDSIQTLITGDLTGSAGSVGQVKECAQRISIVAKRLGIPAFLIGHVTKEGSIAGPRVLEHMVDTVLWFEGERGQPLRLVRAVKNRFGPTDEVGVFEMTEKGLVGVADLSKTLLAERVKNVPGSVVSVVVEGKRPILVEIQALTVPSVLAVPRRVSTGIDFARLQMLIAVLVRRAGLELGSVDIFVNVTGGIKLADRGIDLAVCLAIASAYLDKAVASDIAAVGEIGLLGEVRKVTGIDKRVKEAKKMGYRVASAESGKDVGAAIRKLIRN